MVRGTFIHAPPPPPTPLPSHTRRGHSVPKDLGSSRNSTETDFRTSSPVAAARDDCGKCTGSYEHVTSSIPTAGNESMDYSQPFEYTFLKDQGERRDRVPFCPDEPLCLQDAGDIGCPEHSSLFPFPMMTPSPQCPCSRLDMSTDKSAWETTCRALGLQQHDVDVLEYESCERELEEEESTFPRVRFCSNEPLCIEDVGLFPECNNKTPSSLPICLMTTPSPQYPCNNSLGGISSKLNEPMIYNPMGMALPGVDNAQTHSFPDETMPVESVCADAWVPWTFWNTFQDSSLKQPNFDISSSLRPHVGCDVPVLRIATLI